MDTIPVNPKPCLNRLTRKPAIIKLNWGMEFKGFLVTTDPYINLQVLLPRRPSFCLCCHSGQLVLPTNVESINHIRKKNESMIPSILRSLKLGNDIEKTLNSYAGHLSPKEQTLILKKQSRWEHVLRVFQWFKSQKEYVPNVIHYNIVLRALGRAQQWDELRLCWVEMVKKGILPTNNTYSVLVDVYGRAGLVKESLMWIKHMRLRGIFPDEVSMNTVIKVLKDVGEFNRADRFYKDWCDGRVELDDLALDSLPDSFSGSGTVAISIKHFLSTELFRTGGRVPASSVAQLNAENSTRKPQLTSTYNTLIDLYGKAGRLRDAADVFAEMLKSGVALDTITFNTLIFTCGNHGDLLEAESLLSKMEERGISPDTKTYNIFLSLYANVGNIDAALKCYWKIKEVGLQPDSVTHRALLGVLCERNMVQEVEAVIGEMEKSHIPIDEHSLPGIIKMYVNEGLINKASDFYQRYQINGFLSSKICAAIIDVFAEKGLWAEAETVFLRKRDFTGTKKDVIEYNVMIKAYGKAKLYDKALSLFKGMKNQGAWPDKCTYNSLVQMFSGAGLVDQARELMDEMQQMGFKPDCLTFSAIIGCHAHLNQLSVAVNVYQEMLRTGVKPNEYVYGSLINGFAEYGSIEDALYYYHRMEESGISPNQIVLTSLLKAYCKVGNLAGAKALYEQMKDFEGGLDIVASNSIISLYADLGMVYEAKAVFENMRQQGWADEISHATMMYVYKNMGMLDEAIEVAEEMKQSGLLRDCVSYNKVMLCYATNGQLRECAELMHEMVSRKLLPNKGTFRVLFVVLKKGGFPVEAVKQLELSYLEGKPYARQAAITALFSLVGLHSLALESAQTFTEPELPLESFGYNVAIYAYSSAGNTEKALNVYMKMQDVGVEPDLVSYIHLVGCYGKAGMVEGVKRIYSQLKYGEFESNESLFKAIIDAYKIANRNDLADLVSQEMKVAFDSVEHNDSPNEENSDGSAPVDGLYDVQNEDESNDSSSSMYLKP